MGLLDGCTDLDLAALVQGPRAAATLHDFGASVTKMGRHTEEVLLEHGFDWDDIGTLREGGTLG